MGATAAAAAGGVVVALDADAGPAVPCQLASDDAAGVPDAEAAPADREVLGKGDLLGVVAAAHGFEVVVVPDGQAEDPYWAAD